jgi:protein CpxP
MKSTTKIAAVALAALSFAAANVVLAHPGMGQGMGMGMGMQQGMHQGAGPGMQHGMGPGMQAGGHRGMKGGMQGPETAAATATRLAGVKDALKITPAQEAAWGAYTAVLQAQATARDTLRADMQAKMHDPKTTQAERTAQRDNMGKLRDQHLAERTAALTALQAVLTPEQRAVADQQLTATRGHRMAARGAK